MFDWKILRTKVNSYASGTTAATMLTDMTTKSLSGPNQDVSVSTVVGFLMLESDFLTLQSFSQSTTTGNTTHDAALNAAKMLMALVTTPNAPSFAMSNPTTYASIKALADAILAQETATPGTTGFTQTVHDGLLALAAVSQSWADQNGWTGITVDQVNYALSAAVQNDPNLQ